MITLPKLYGGAKYLKLLLDEILVNASPRTLTVNRAGDGRLIMPEPSEIDRVGKTWFLINDGTNSFDVVLTEDLGGSTGTASRFGVVGDFGDGSSESTAVASMVNGWGGVSVIGAGDIAYPVGSATNYANNVGTRYGGNLYPCPGNHDWQNLSSDGSAGGGSLAAYLAYFNYLPLSNPAGNPEGLPSHRRYYRKQWGQAEFFFIDSDQNEPDGTSAGSVQGVWLQNALGNSTAKWKIVVAHHPPYSSGSSHGSATWMRWPFETWGADLVISGHNHNYERLKQGNLIYLVSGNGGAGLNGFGTPVSGSLFRYSADHGATQLVADRRFLKIRHYNTAGALVDDYGISKVSVTGPIVTVNAGEMAIVVLVNNCDGNREWKLGKRVMNTTHLVETTPGRPTACAYNPLPPTPPPPDSLCTIEAYHTGQSHEPSTAGGPCDEDLRWSVKHGPDSGGGGADPVPVPARLTNADSSWASETLPANSPDAAWLASKCDNVNNDFFNAMFSTKVYVSGDPTLNPLRGVYYVASMLLETYVNGQPTGIKFMDNKRGYNYPHEIYITASMGLKEGENIIEFNVRHSPSNNENSAWGLYVKWLDLCPNLPQTPVDPTNPGGGIVDPGQGGGTPDPNTCTDTPSENTDTGGFNAPNTGSGSGGGGGGGTGYGGSGTVGDNLPKTDGNWTADGDPAVIPTTTSSNFPCATTSATAGARWIQGVNACAPSPALVQDHTYEVKITLTADPATNPLSGQYSVDNQLLDILVNGASTGISYTLDTAGWAETRPFTLTEAMGLVLGENTITFNTRKIRQVASESTCDGLWVKWDENAVASPQPAFSTVKSSGGTEGLGGTDCDEDPNWSVTLPDMTTVQGRVTQRQTGWIVPPEGSQWVSASCDPTESGGVDLYDFTTHVNVLGDSVVYIKGRYSTSYALFSIVVNGTEYPIDQDAAYDQMYAFEITREMGLVTGDNVITFRVRPAEGYPAGLLVAWDGALPVKSAGCDPVTLGACPESKLVTIAGGVGPWATANGVHEVTKPVGQNYWRLQWGAWTLTLQCVSMPVQGQPQGKWQGLLDGGIGLKKRFVVSDMIQCPPNGAWPCVYSASEGTNCTDPVTFVVSD